VLVLILLAGASSARSPDPGSPQAAIQRLLEHPDTSGGAGRIDPGRLRVLYSKRRFAPLWTVKGKLTRQGGALVRALRSADDYGLRPQDYDTDSIVALLQRNRVHSPADLASFDLQLTRAAARFLEHLHQGRADPRAAGFELRVARPQLDLGAHLSQLATTRDVEAELASVEPSFYHYKLLKAALKQYRQLAAQPQLTLLPKPGGHLKPGQAYAGAPALRTLLTALGDLPPATAGSSPQDGEALDPQLVEGLQHFQARHGIEPNGSLGPSTYAALTVPLAQRVRQIELTLERWRWLPSFDTPPIVVNIPQYRLFAFRSTQDRKADILQLDVIVGQRFPSKRTPVFAADMSYVIFRPYWDIPTSILEQEMLPKIRANPSYLTDEHLQIVAASSNDDDAQPLPATPENIDALAAGKLRLRQEPGPDNALGLIKLMFPNSYDVYLHGTPAQELFKRSRRDFSHGCIRVSDPIALAVHVLRDTAGEWTQEKVEAAMQSGPANQRVNLARPIRVLIVYGTAMALEDGSVLFLDDIYGHDGVLESLLQLPPVAPGPGAPAPGGKAATQAALPRRS